MEVLDNEKALREDKNTLQKDEIVSLEEPREHTPTFPDEIYDFIPSILKECVQIVKEEHEKDMGLLFYITFINDALRGAYYPSDNQSALIVTSPVTSPADVHH